MEELVRSTAGPQKEKRLAGPENAIARGKKENENQPLRVWEEEKSCARPEKAEKRVWKVDFSRIRPEQKENKFT